MLSLKSDNMLIRSLLASVGRALHGASGTRHGPFTAAVPHCCSHKLSKTAYSSQHGRSSWGLVLPGASHLLPDDWRAS